MRVSERQRECIIKCICMLVLLLDTSCLIKKVSYSRLLTDFIYLSTKHESLKRDLKVFFFLCFGNN